MLHAIGLPEPIAVRVFNCKFVLTELLCRGLGPPQVILADSAVLFLEQRNMWKELYLYISQLVISSAGQPLTSLRDSDTHKGSIPTVEKEVGKQFNAVKGWEQSMSKERQRKGEDQLLKCFQQVGAFSGERQEIGNDDLYKMNSSYSDKFGDMVPVKEARSVYFKDFTPDDVGMRLSQYDCDQVVVYDYIWKDHANKSCISSSDAQHQGEILKSVGKAEGTTVHVAIYTVHLAGFQELYRHFLRLPNGAIVEVRMWSLVKASQSRTMPMPLPLYHDLQEDSHHAELETPLLYANDVLVCQNWS
ncbi:hypothetical protein lerEdw1_007152 [Lerista edwardsae]|nr:hypothetical protein lerEdw1_007152 [Lerista edwardsae]